MPAVLPLAPALDKVGRYTLPGSPERCGVSELARRSGVSRTSIHRAVRQLGGITVDMAETLADGLGYLPVEVWGRAYYDAAAGEP